jgi:hypothetical protein
MRTNWLLISSMILAFFTGSLATAGDAPTAPSDPEQTSAVAKDLYEIELAQANRTYLNAVAKARAEYIQSLETAVKQAMANQDLDLAEKLDAERKAAAETMEKHKATVTADSPALDVAAPNGSDERTVLAGKLAGSKWKSGGYGLSYVFNQDSTVTRTDDATGFWFPISGNSVLMMDSHGYAGIVTFDEKLSTFNERFSHLDSSDQGNRAE